MSDENWQPDESLVLTLRTRVVPIATLTGPDRAWVVAALTVDKWTVQAIAERLGCSLRLVQQIKAEPMTKVAMHALALEVALQGERRLRALEANVAASALSTALADVERLRNQRDALISQIRHATMRKAS